jgi:hypothetical protein
MSVKFAFLKRNQIISMVHLAFVLLYMWLCTMKSEGCNVGGINACFLCFMSKFGKEKDSMY